MITIAHLYYDLLNLYGENGNVKALKKHLQDQNVKVRVQFLSVDDKLDFDSYDVVYIGSGTEENLKLALKHLYPYRRQIKKAIEVGKLFIVTGNALSLFGKTIETQDKTYKALQVFNYTAKEETFRIVGECLGHCYLIKQPILGFQNRSFVLKNVEEQSLFELEKGTGYLPKENCEGIFYQHFYGTFLIGPLLVRNPYFLKYLIKEIFHQKNVNVKPFHMSLEIKAYQNFIKNNYQKN